MNFWIILAIVAVICLMNRGSREDRRHARRSYGSPQRDEQIDKLTARVTTLEEILLDRDRRFRDQFRGL